MNVTLRPDLERLIERKLATGRYADRGAVIEEALEFVQRRDEWTAQAQAGVQRGTEDMDAGRYRTVGNSDEAKALVDEIKQRGRELRAKREQTAH